MRDVLELAWHKHKYILAFFLYSHKTHPVKWRGVWWELKLLTEWSETLSDLGVGLTRNDCLHCWLGARVWAGCEFAPGGSLWGEGMWGWLCCSRLMPRPWPLLLLLSRAAWTGSCHHLVPKWATAGWLWVRDGPELPLVTELWQEVPKTVGLTPDLPWDRPSTQHWIPMLSEQQISLTRNSSNKFLLIEIPIAFCVFHD